jgi:hypothetical protein
MAIPAPLPTAAQRAGRAVPRGGGHGIMVGKAPTDDAFAHPTGRSVHQPGKQQNHGSPFLADDTSAAVDRGGAGEFAVELVDAVRLD